MRSRYRYAIVFALMVFAGWMLAYAQHRFDWSDVEVLFYGQLVLCLFIVSSLPWLIEGQGWPTLIREGRKRKRLGVKVAMLHSCARCQQDHPVTFYPLTYPVDTVDPIITHWGMCETNHEPILMRYVDTPEVEVKEND